MTNKNFYPLLLLISALVLTSFLSGTDPESNLLRSILNKLQNQYSWYPQQKTYLHTDKFSYNADERVWFKAWLVDATSHEPDKLSTNLYIDLLNPSGYVVQTRLIRLENGSGHGSFTLQDTVPEGLYRIRAYTNWMRNTGEDYLFHQDIYINNPLFSTYATNFQVQRIKKAKRQTARMEKNFNISFHPEGGNLLEGVENLVGFKAINDLGYGVDFSGKLMDKKGKVIHEFTSEHRGMGSFRFTPLKNEKYHVLAEFPGEQEFRFPLPESIGLGVNLSLDHVGKDTIYIKLKSSLLPENYPADTRYHLIAHTRGNPRFTAELDLKETDRILPVQKSIFPTGVAHFTIFNSRSNPVSERLLFIQHNDQLKVQINNSKSIAGKREKISSAIRIMDPEGNPAKGNFSLAVVSQTKLRNESNILTNLLLSSDLRGNIENPGYYFEGNNLQRESHLEALMLTQGWRRFDWNTVMLNTKRQSNYPIEEGIEISGKITRELFAIPLSDIKVTLTILNEFNDVYTTRSDLKGRFSFKNLIYPDTVQVKIEAVRNSGKKNLVIYLDQKNPENLEEMNYITRQYLRKPGEEGRWITKKTPEEIEKENDPFYEENNRYPRLHQEPNDVIIMDENLQNYSNVAQIIQGRVPGVMVSGDNIIIRGVNSFYGGTDPLFIVDGVPVDKGFAMSMNPYDIDRIEILKGPETAIYGSRGANGVIAIYTKRGKFMLKGVLDFEMIGYHTPREFYSPRYEIAGRDELFEDDRTTLYWQPLVKTDSNGQAVVSFYTSDLEEDFEVILEGIDSKGIPGSGSSVFTVK